MCTPIDNIAETTAHTLYFFFLFICRKRNTITITTIPNTINHPITAKIRMPICGPMDSTAGCPSVVLPVISVGDPA